MKMSYNKELITCGMNLANNSKRFQTFYDDEDFIDITLISGIDNVKVKAHRIVLAASSDYFLTRFRNNLKEPTSDAICLNSIDGVTLKTIIEFMYTDKIELSSENVETILIAADFLHIKPLMDISCSFMMTRFDLSNCLGIAFLAQQHSFQELYGHALIFAYNNYSHLCEQTEFYKLNEEQLTKLIVNDIRFMRSEETLFHSIVAWINYDRTSREQHSYILLSHVRFPLLNHKFITMNSYKVCKSIETYELIFSWLKWHSVPEARTPSCQMKQRNRFAFVSEPGKVCEFWIFLPDWNMWYRDELPWFTAKKHKDYSCIVVNNKLFIVGGHIGGSFTNVVKCLDLETMKWTTLEPMLYKVTAMDIIELDGLLYVIGGNDGCDWTCNMQTYNISENKWVGNKSVPINHERIRVTALQGCIYAYGCNHINMYCFNPNEESWSEIPLPLNTQNFPSYMCTADEKYLYLIVLNTNQGYITVDRYDPVTQIWTIISNLKADDEPINCAVLNDRLIVVQGKKVWEYIPDTDKWKNLEPRNNPLCKFDNFVTIK